MADRKKQRTGLCISTMICLMSSTLTLQAIPYHVDTTLQFGSKVSSTSTALLSYFHRNNQSAFIAGQYQVNNDSWIASTGLGYRHLFGNQLLIGGYVFGDLLHTNDQRKYYVLSPGLDIQTDTLHFNTNVYIPIGPKKLKLMSPGQTYHLEGHTASRKDHNTYEQSMLGVDAMLTYTPKTKYNVGIGIGGYHYRAKKGDIKQQAHLTGIKGQLAYQPFDRITLSGEYRYDKENKSRYILNVGFNFSPGQQDAPMKNKLNSIVDRNMNLNTTKQGMALEEQTLATSHVYNNVHFVHGTLGSSSGTGEYHSPHSSLGDALTASASKDSPHIWLAGDHTYTKASGNVTVNADNTTIMGRSLDYQTATKGSDANAAVVAINDGGLVLSNGSHVEGFKLETVGITVYDSGDWVASMNYGIKNNASQVVSIKDMFIASTVANSSAKKDVASILNYGTINFSGNNTISATVGLAQGNGTVSGIYNYDNSSSSFTGGTNTITAATENNNGWAYGIFNHTNNSSSSFTNGINTITGTAEGSGYARGIYNNDSSSSFTGGTNTITATINGSGSGNAIGIHNYNNASSSFTGGINTITGTAEGSGSGQARGINNSMNSSSSFTNGINTITATAEGSGVAIGIYNSSSYSSFADSTTTIAATAKYGGRAYGIYNDNNGSSSFTNGTNTITATANDSSNVYGIYNYNSSSAAFTGGTNTITATTEGIGNARGIYNFSSSISFTGENNTIRAIADTLAYAYPYYGSGSDVVTGSGNVTCKSGTNETPLSSVECEFPSP